MAGKLDRQLNLSIDAGTEQTLAKIYERHTLKPTDFGRRLVEAACQFYEEHGWFSFPVVIEPEAFQARYVAEEQAAYESGKKKPKKL